MKKAIIFSAILSMLFLTNSITQAQPMKPPHQPMGIMKTMPLHSKMYRQHHLRPMPMVYRCHHHNTFGSIFRGLNISLNF